MGVRIKGVELRENVRVTPGTKKSVRIRRVFVMRRSTCSYNFLCSHYNK